MTVRFKMVRPLFIYAEVLTPTARINDATMHIRNASTSGYLLRRVSCNSPVTEIVALLIAPSSIASRYPDQARATDAAPKIYIINNQE